MYIIGIYGYIHQDVDKIDTCIAWLIYGPGSVVPPGPGHGAMHGAYYVICIYSIYLLHLCVDHHDRL